MYSMAARRSASESDALPPLGGIAPLPLAADCTRASLPCLMRGAQAALSPSFGALATPASWQVLQEVLYVSSAVAANTPPAATRVTAPSIPSTNDFIISPLKGATKTAGII